MLNTKRFFVDLATVVNALEHQEAQALTLEELVRAYDSKTREAGYFRLNKWLAALGHLSAWDITSEQLSAAAQAMVDGGYKPSTPNRDLSALGSIYRWAIRQRLSPRGFRSPTKGALRFKEAIRRVYVTDEQVEAIRRRSLAYPDRRFGLFVALLLDSGARRSEISQRRWGEVNLDRCEILLPMSKNGKPRTLHFSLLTLKLLLRVFPNPPKDGLIFEGRVPGQPVNYKASWRRLTSDVGLPELHLHDIRHIVAAGMLRNGVSIAVASQVLGNSPVVLANRYGHLETQVLKRALSSQWNQN